MINIFFLTHVSSPVAPSQAQKAFDLLEVESKHPVLTGIVTWLVSGLGIEESQYDLFSFIMQYFTNCGSC